MNFHPLEFGPVVCIFLLRTAIVTTIILLAALLSVAWFRRKSAAIRHGLWFAGIVGCWIGPILAACFPAWSLWSPLELDDGVSPTSYEAPIFQSSAGGNSSSTIDEIRKSSAATSVDVGKVEFAGAQFAGQENPPDSTHVFPRGSQAIPQPTGRESLIRSPFLQWLVVRSELLAGWLVAVWLIIAAGLLWSLAISLLKSNRLCRMATAQDTSALQQQLSAMQTELNIRQAIEVRFSTQVAVPTVAGFIRPYLLLPPASRNWPCDQWHAVLRHELGHIQRRDLLTQLLAETAAAVWWFQPLLWHAARKLRIEREFACDDLVLRSGTSSCEYADQLLHVASQAVSGPVTSPALVSMASQTNIRRRIEAILNVTRDRTPWDRRGLAFVVTTLGFIVGIVVLLTPTVSESKPPGTPDSNVATAPEESKDEPTKNSADASIEVAPQVETEGQTSVRVVDAEGQPVPEGELEITGKTHRDAYISSLLPIHDGKAVIDWKDRQLDAVTFKIKSPGSMAHYQKFARRKEEAYFEPEKVYEFQLKSGITIGGKVVDQHGKPVANAKIYAYCPTNKPIESGIDVFEQTVSTDANGVWGMSGAPPDLPKLMLRLSEQAGIFPGDVSAVTAAHHAGLKNQTDTRTLNVPDIVQATVVDPDGRPIEGAMVLLAGREFYKDYDAKLVPRTDATGIFPLANLTQGSQIITIFSLDWALETLRVEFPLKDPLRIMMRKGKRVEFHAVDEQGGPVAGTRFHPEAPRTGPFTGDQHVNYLGVLDFLSHRDLLKNESNERGEFIWENAPDESLGYQIISSKMLSQPGGDFGPAGSPHTIVFRPIIPLNVAIVDNVTSEPIPEYRTFQGTHFKANAPDQWSWSLDRPAEEAKPGLFTTHLRALDRLTQLRIQANGYRPSLTQSFDAANLPNDPIAVELRLKQDTGFDAVVQTADFAAAAAAKIYTRIARREDHNGLQVIDGIVDESSATSTITADSTGRFHIPPQNEPFVCFIWHETGYAELMDVELYQQPKIVLKPWAAIQGTLHKRAAPAENTKVVLLRNHEISTHSEGLYVVYQSTRTTGTDGAFQFDRVVAGEWEEIITWDDTRVGFDQPAYLQYSSVSVVPGQTLIQHPGNQAATVRIPLAIPEETVVDWARSSAQLIAWKPVDPADDDNRRGRRRIQETRHGFHLSRGKSIEFFGVQPGDYELKIVISRSGDPVESLLGARSLTITSEMIQKNATDGVVDLAEIAVSPDAK